MEVVTGYLGVNELEEEVAAIAHWLVQTDNLAVLVTFGFGCDRSDLEADTDVVVSSVLLPEFIEQHEERGVLRLGRSDLSFKSADGRIRFLLCDESDIHCYTQDEHLFEEVCSRWAECYPEAHEADRELRRYRRLSGSQWVPFVTDEDGRG